MPLKDAIDWAFKGIEDQNSLLCLCPTLKKEIREFIRAKKERSYMSAEALHELEEGLLLRVSDLKPKPIKRRINGKQIKQQAVVDKTTLNTGACASQGGFTRIDKSFSGKLKALLEDLHSEIWNDGAD